MMLERGNAEGEALIMGAVDALVNQTRAIERAVTVLGGDEIAGSDNLGAPEAASSNPNPPGRCGSKTNQGIRKTMIVCHCQNITDRDINNAIDWMRAPMRARSLPRGKIRALGKAADCGGCMPLFLFHARKWLAFPCRADNHSKSGKTKQGDKFMKGDDKVIEYLSAALRSELTAVSQYCCITGCKKTGAMVACR